MLAAVEALDRSGPDVLSLRELARDAGVTAAAPYAHFADKAELLAAVSEDGFRLLGEAQAKALAKSGADPFERLRRLGRAYVEFAVAHRAHFSVMFRAWLPPGSEPGLRRSADAAFAPLMTALGEAHESGALTMPPADAALALWSLVHGLASLWIAGPVRDLWGRQGAAKLAERPLDLLVQALRARR